MTLVDHSRDHDLAVQGSQAARARAIALLVEQHDLPTVSTWDISDCSDRLSGLIFADHDDTDGGKQREAVTAWAAYLDSPLRETTSDGRTVLSAEGWAYGVRVRIWAQLRTDSSGGLT